MIAGILLAAVAAVRLSAIAQNFDGKAGIAAIHLETGQRITFRANDNYPMASVYKVPIAVAFLQKVDRENISLDTKVTLGPEDFHAGHSPIAEEANGKPITVSLQRLVLLTVRDSDNSASDYILEHYVSPKEVMKAMKAIGVKGVDVSRPEGMIIGQILNLGDKVMTREEYAKRTKSITPDERSAGLGKFWRDPRDTASPNGLADLLVKIYRHQAGLSAKSEKLLLAAMTAATNAPDRLRAGIPAGSTLAHKTGTMPGTLNDVGIITSPDGKHHLVIVAMTKWSGGTESDRAKVVAAMTKAVYEELTQP
jgi:beta-lactamase class A